MQKHNSRVESLRKRLEDRLDNEVGNDAGRRVLWLIDHFEEYLERWLSFAKLGDIDIASTMSNEVFYVVLAATRVISDKINHLDVMRAFPRGEWQHFCNALEWIQKTGDRSDLQLIVDTFEAFSKKLPPGEVGSACGD